MGYKKDVIKGVSWIAILRILTRVISLGKTVVLARILLPSQFGAYGVALLVLGFLEVMTETGVNVILIQEKKTNKFIDSAWIVSIIRGTIIALAIIIATPFIATFFHSPESEKLLYLISIVPFLRGFINPSVVKFQKELRFRIEFWYRFVAFAVDAFVSIILTVWLRDPIGIIIGFIAGVCVEIALSYVLVKPFPRFVFHKEYFLRIFHRGKWVTASGVFNYLFHNADNIIVGRILGASSLGVYQMAYSFSMLPITEIADVFGKVTFPVYTKIAGDKKRLRNAFLQTTGVITLLTLPFGLILWFFPELIVSVVLGDKWLAAAPLLPVLGLFGVVRAISGSSSALFLAVGKQEYVTVVTLVSIVSLVIAIFPLIHMFGLIGAAYSVVIATFVALPVCIYFSIKTLFR